MPERERRRSACGKNGARRKRIETRRLDRVSNEVRRFQRRVLLEKEFLSAAEGVPAEGRRRGRQLRLDERLDARRTRPQFVKRVEDTRLRQLERRGIDDRLMKTVAIGRDDRSIRLHFGLSTLSESQSAMSRPRAALRRRSVFEARRRRQAWRHA